jgi:aspartate racemase
MKTIGLLGGMSWESSIEYERIINEGVRVRLGGNASADLIVRSYNFAAIEELQDAGEWEAAGSLLARDAVRLQSAGADLLVLCTNTMHVVAPAIEDALDVPFVHIGDATAEAVRATGITTVGLLGTRYTMEHEFYRSRLEDHGLRVLVPPEGDRVMVHDVIYGELVRGVIRDESKQRYLNAIARLIENGAQGIIAGCTEVELLIHADDLDVPYFPTARLHAQAAVTRALAP